MLETSRICGVLMLAMLASCVEAPPKPEASASDTAAQPAPPVPAGPTEAERKAAQMEEARALLARPGPITRRGGARGALGQKGGEPLAAPRQAVGGGAAPRAISPAPRPSELAQLGLEQLAYPAIQ